MLNHNQITVSDQLVNYDYSRKEESKDSIISWMSKISRSTVVLKEHGKLFQNIKFIQIQIDKNIETAVNSNDK